MALGGEEEIDIVVVVAMEDWNKEEGEMVDDRIHQSVGMVGVAYRKKVDVVDAVVVAALV